MQLLDYTLTKYQLTVDQLPDELRKLVEGYNRLAQQATTDSQKQQLAEFEKTIVVLAVQYGEASAASRSKTPVFEEDDAPSSGASLTFRLNGGEVFPKFKKKFHWVAQITGPSQKYTFERTFINDNIDEAGGFTASAVLVEDEYYEICDGFDRYYAFLDNGKIEKIGKEQIVERFNAPVRAPRPPREPKRDPSVSSAPKGISGDVLTFEQKLLLNFCQLEAAESKRQGSKVHVIFDPLSKKAYFIEFGIWSNYSDNNTTESIKTLDAEWFDYYSNFTEKMLVSMKVITEDGRFEKHYSFYKTFKEMSQRFIRISDYAIKNIPSKFQGRRIGKDIKLSKYEKYSNKRLLLHEILLGKIHISQSNQYKGDEYGTEFFKLSQAKFEHFSEFLRGSFERCVESNLGEDVRYDKATDTFEIGNSAFGYYLKYVTEKADVYGNKPKPTASSVPSKASAPSPSNDQAKAFYKTAESLRAKGKKWINDHRNALTNTPKRQHEYDSGRIDANAMLEKANIYEVIGKAYENGNLPEILRGISAAQSNNDLRPFMFATKSDGYYSIYTTNERYFKNGNPPNPKFVEQWAAIEQLLGGKKSKTAEEERAELIKKKIEAVRFTKIDGFFPTTDKIIEGKMLPKAGIKDGFKILEPSAGIGSIADMLRERYPSAQIDVCESNWSLREILELKGYNLVGDDTLKLTGQYDAIVMNPPFENGQDAEHVRYCYDNLLKAGGTLVAIMASSFTYHQGKKYTAFRDFLQSANGSQEKLPDDAFNGRDAFRQTAVKTMLVTLKKPSNSTASTPSVSEPITRQTIERRIRGIERNLPLLENQEKTIAERRLRGLQRSLLIF